MNPRNSRVSVCVHLAETVVKLSGMDPVEGPGTPFFRTGAFLEVPDFSSQNFTFIVNPIKVGPLEAEFFGVSLTVFVD